VWNNGEVTSTGPKARQGGCTTSPVPGEGTALRWSALLGYAGRRQEAKDAAGGSINSRVRVQGRQEDTPFLPASAAWARDAAVSRAEEQGCIGWKIDRERNLPDGALSGLTRPKTRIPRRVRSVGFVPGRPSHGLSPRPVATLGKPRTEKGHRKPSPEKRGNVRPTALPSGRPNEGPKRPAIFETHGLANTCPSRRQTGSAAPRSGESLSSMRPTEKGKLLLKSN